MSKESNAIKVAGIGVGLIAAYTFFVKNKSFFSKPKIEDQLDIRNGQVVFDVVEKDRLRSSNGIVLAMAEAMLLVTEQKIRTVLLFRFFDETDKIPIIEDAAAKLRGVGAVVINQVFFRGIKSLTPEMIDTLMESIVTNSAATDNNVEVFVKEGNNVFVPIKIGDEVQEMLVDDFFLREILIGFAPLSIRLNISSAASRSFAKQIEDFVLENKLSTTILETREV